LVSILSYILKTDELNQERQMLRKEIEDRINQLEDDYSRALDQRSDLDSLSQIWQKIKELKQELAAGPMKE
jgi:hypothetical protein